MIEQLFGSKTRVKLLRLFFSNPNRSFYVREITRTIDEQINSVRRELSNLLSLGLISSDSSSNNRLYYEVNQDFEHYAALRSMFSESAEPIELSEESTTDEKPKNTVNKSDKSAKTSKKDDKTSEKQEKPTPSAADEPVELPEAKKWVNAGNIVGIAYSGVYSRDESAGVDIVVIGDVVPSKIDSVVAGLEKEKNLELRYVMMDTTEWKYRSQVRDKFWLQFMGAKKQIVLDKEHIFEDK